MLKERRLTRPQDFAAARRHGRSWSNGLLVLSARRNDLELSRFGFSVGRRVGKAVVRNRVKRRLREIARKTEVSEGWDLVVAARSQASDASFAALRQSMTGLLRRAGLLDSACRASSRPAGATPCSR